MNLQLANVLSDLSGVTGQAIVRAILAGERNPRKLAELRDKRVKASEEEIAQSLEGNWQEDLLFLLKQEQDSYKFCLTQLAECDQQLQGVSQAAERSKCRSRPAGRETTGTASQEKGKQASVRSARRVISHDRDRPDAD